MKEMTKRYLENKLTLSDIPVIVARMHKHNVKVGHCTNLRWSIRRKRRSSDNILRQAIEQYINSKLAL